MHATTDCRALDVPLELPRSQPPADPRRPEAPEAEATVARVAGVAVCLHRRGGGKKVYWLPLEPSSSLSSPSSSPPPPPRPSSLGHPFEPAGALASSALGTARGAPAAEAIEPEAAEPAAAGAAAIEPAEESARAAIGRLLARDANLICYHASPLLALLAAERIEVRGRWLLMAPDGS